MTTSEKMLRSPRSRIEWSGCFKIVLRKVRASDLTSNFSAAEPSGLRMRKPGSDHCFPVETGDRHTNSPYSAVDCHDNGIALGGCFAPQSLWQQLLEPGSRQLASSHGTPFCMGEGSRKIRELVGLPSPLAHPTVDNLAGHGSVPLARHRSALHTRRRLRAADPGSAAGATGAGY
jgi:hypothetical protein